MSLRMTGNACARPDTADSHLHVVCVGRHKANALRSNRPHRIDAGKRRRRGRFSGARTDSLTKALVALDSKPAGRGAVPGYGIDFGVGKQICSRQHPCWIKLIERGGIERDLSHAEAGEMGTDPGDAGEHSIGNRLENGIRRWREHTEARSHRAHRGLKFRLTRPTGSTPRSTNLAGKSQEEAVGAVTFMARPPERCVSTPRG